MILLTEAHSGLTCHLQMKVILQYAGLTSRNQQLSGCKWSSLMMVRSCPHASMWQWYWSGITADELSVVSNIQEECNNTAQMNTRPGPTVDSW